MKLVLVTQALDRDHPVLAQTVDLAEALASRLDRLDVCAREARWDALPGNATVRTFDAGSRAGRVVAFERALAASLPGADGVLVHMVPQFALLAAPLTRVRRVPLALWYTHWHESRALRFATRTVDLALSVDRSSYPIATAKLRPVGHAIDVHTFVAAAPPPPSESLRLLALGRTARWKGLATLLDAVAAVVGRGTPIELELRGPSLTSDEEAHRRELAARIAGDERLRSSVRLLEPLPRAEIPAAIAAVDAVVSPNEPRSGSTLDKAVFEAAACARPAISTNPDFAPLLGGLPLRLLSAPGDPAALAETIERPGGAHRRSIGSRPARSCGAGSCATTRSSTGRAR